MLNRPTRGLGNRTAEKLILRAQEASISRYEAAKMLLHIGLLRGPQRRAVERFLTMIEGWVRDRDRLPLLQLFDRIVQETDYERFLRDGTIEGESRWENILTLRGVIADAPEVSLSDFLTEVALIADVDTLEETEEAVTLLTLHSAKGLEYRIVFIVGLEEGLLPHRRSLEESPDALAEERRLFYVGMTRAKEELYLTRAFRRGWYGSDQVTEPSRFLEEIPAHLRREQGRSPQPSRTLPQWQSATWQRPQSTERRFRAGERVRHRRFGVGRVLDSRIEDGYEIVTILFTDNGIGVKQFLAEKAPLEPVSNA